MKKLLLTALTISLSAPMWAQSAVDAYNISQTQLRGTARFMSMGGAFTALGGDLSVMGQNPAGIGVYRRSEIGATLDISPSKFTAGTGAAKSSDTKTTVACNNFGYIGSARLDGAMRTFNWGVSYSRVASFDRVFTAFNPAVNGSLTNYVAAYTSNNASASNPDDLDFGKDYNPYLDINSQGTYNDWLSVLAYTSSMITPVRGGGYVGLYQNGTTGTSTSVVREKGYVDEYNIDFGGNVSDVLYWGIGFGITDLSYTRNAVYSESLADSRVPVGGDLVNGDAAFDLANYQHISGSGWNFKAGVIVKPINELRIGLAVHTPTWYSLSQSGYATTAFDYYDPSRPESKYDEHVPGSFDNPYSGSQYTDDSYYNFQVNAPWRFMVGVAGVIGNSAILSLDYERQAFGDMKVKYQNGYGEYISSDYVNDDIKNYYKATDIIRLGAEYRVTPRFSLRAGYSYATTNVKNEAADGAMEIYTSGTNPAYMMDDDTYSISAGLGYRYKAFSIDGAYVYRNRKSTYHAYTGYDGMRGPSTEVSQSTNSIVLSLGFRF